MSNMHFTNLSRIHGKLLKLLRQQNKIINVKCEKFKMFFSAIIELVQDLVTIKMKNKFEKDT